MDRPVFSERAGRSHAPHLDEHGLRIAFFSTYLRFAATYFQQAFGKSCPDGDDLGERGLNIEDALFLRFGDRDLRLTEIRVRGMTYDDIFDLIEFLHDAVAKPTKTYLHEWNGCGRHVTKADSILGKQEWEDAINQHLARLNPPYRLTNKGEIQLLPTDAGLKALIDERPISSDATNVDQRVTRAIDKFFARHASHDDQRDAIRLLADVLEFLEKDVKGKLTTKDSSDLFLIANKYAIRHHDGKQVQGYDPAFYPWIFQVYLATINLIIRLNSSKENHAPSAPS